MSGREYGIPAERGYLQSSGTDKAGTGLVRHRGAGPVFQRRTGLRSILLRPYGGKTAPIPTEHLQRACLRYWLSDAVQRRFAAMGKAGRSSTQQQPFCRGREAQQPCKAGVEHRDAGYSGCVLSSPAAGGIPGMGWFRTKCSGGADINGDRGEAGVVLQPPKPSGRDERECGNPRIYRKSAVQ